MKLINWRGVLIATSVLSLSMMAPAHGAEEAVKIGVLTDLSGPYSDMAGAGSIEAAKMAIEDYGKPIFGKKIELVVGDHRNKADVGAAIAREWYDTGTSAIFEMVASSVALAVSDIARDKNKVSISTGAASSDLTNKSCTTNSAQWAYDTYGMSKATANTVASQKNGKKWYFITVDYAFGHSLEKDASEFVKKAGGQIVGQVRHPLGATDFSSYILQAQSSGADVVALASGGSDMVNAIRAAGEFGLTQGGQQLIALLPHITEIHALGLKAAQGIVHTEGFYWDRTDASRTWSKRFFERRKAMPTQVQAGVYSAVMHYLKAVEATQTTDGLKVMKQMQDTPVNDFFAENGTLRRDGRMIHDIYVVQVKKPEESKYPWDYYTILKTVPKDEAFRPVSESVCPLLKAQN